MFRIRLICLIRGLIPGFGMALPLCFMCCAPQNEGGTILYKAQESGGSGMVPREALWHRLAMGRDGVGDDRVMGRDAVMGRWRGDDMGNVVGDVGAKDLHLLIDSGPIY
jgi:hypothetical protein